MNNRNLNKFLEGFWNGFYLLFLIGFALKVLEAAAQFFLEYWPYALAAGIMLGAVYVIRDQRSNN